MKIAIKVTYENCHILDGVIKQYGLCWAYERSVSELEETSVMNNYLVIDPETKTLHWTENNPYGEVSIFTLIDRLNAFPKTITIEQWEVRYITGDKRLIMMGYLTKGKAEEAISYLNSKVTILNGPSFIERRIELKGN